MTNEPRLSLHELSKAPWGGMAHRALPTLAPKGGTLLPQVPSLPGLVLLGPAQVRHLTSPGRGGEGLRLAWKPLWRGEELGIQGERNEHGPWWCCPGTGRGRCLKLR